MRKSLEVLSLTLGIGLLLGVLGAAFVDAPAATLATYQEFFLSKGTKFLGVEEQKPTERYATSGSEIPPEGEDPIDIIQSETVGQTPVPATDLELQRDLEEYLSSRAGVYGVAVRNVDTGQTVLINSDLRFPSASTYKLLVMYRVYQQMERGMLDADDLLTITWADVVEADPEGGLYAGQTVTVTGALEAMITISSNAAAYALTRVVGGWGSLDTAANELRMSQTGQQVYYFQTTPGDMLTFFEALDKGQLVSANASRSMTQLLRRQKVNDRIPALLPVGTIVAHKTGELPGVRNDVGIVYGSRGRYIICALGQRANEVEATEVIAQVSLRAYERYSQ